MTTTDLDRIEERARHGVPAWERKDFLETVVPQLVREIRRLKEHFDEVPAPALAAGRPRKEKP